MLNHVSLDSDVIIKRGAGSGTGGGGGSSTWRYFDISAIDTSNQEAK